MRSPSGQSHLLLQDWTRTEPMFALPGEYFFIWSLRKLPLTFHSLLSVFEVLCVDIVLTNRHLIKWLGVFVDENVQGYSFCPPKISKSTKQIYGVPRKRQRKVWKSKRFDQSDLSSVLHKDVSAGCFSGGTEKCKLLSILLDKEIENWDEHGCPKNQQLVDPKAVEEKEIAPATRSDTKPPFTVQSKKKNKFVW